MVKRDTRTLDLLLDWEPSPVAVAFEPGVAGRGDLPNQIARVLSRALDDAKESRQISRQDVANLMSLDLGRTVSKDQLDKWTSEASASHRIPLDAFIALLKVTEVDELVGFVAAFRSLAVVPQRYSKIVELHLLEEKEKELAAHKEALRASIRSPR